MSEYDHMMRGGKTGSGPMADHIQARSLGFFCARGEGGASHRAAYIALLRVPLLPSHASLSPMWIEGSACASASPVHYTRHSNSHAVLSGSLWRQ